MLANLTCEFLLLMLVTLWSPTGITVGVFSWRGDTRWWKRLPLIWLCQLGLAAVLYVGIEFFRFRESLGVVVAVTTALGIAGTLLVLVIHQLDTPQ